MKAKILLLYSSLEEGAPFPRLIKIGKPKYNYTEVNGNKQKKMFLNQFACLQKYSIIRSNVGGWKFTTTLINLCPENGSVLKRMFSDGFTISRDSKGAAFIDRNDEHFNFILDYLRGNIVGLDDFLFNAKTRKRLIKEAEYYQLQGIKNILAFKASSAEKEDDCDYM